MPENNEKNDENQKLDIDTLSTILTDSELRTDDLKKLDEQKKVDEIPKENGIIFDINIKTIDDLIDILVKNEYDFLAIEPNSDFAKISFKKDSSLKQTINIKFPIYFNLILQAKKISKLNIEENSIEQKGSGEYKLNEKNYDILSKVVPGELGETLFLKASENKKVEEKIKPKKTTISASQAFGFLGAILFIALVLGGVFLTFVIFNAQTPQDVSFFSNLGINLNDVNSFLLKLTTIIFSIVVVIETILLVILLFKALLTKKELKKKKTILTISSIFALIVTFMTGTLWLSLDKAIKNLPNWQEMSYGNIQIYDNTLLTSKLFKKENAIIKDYTNIIGPASLKFDLKYLEKDELRRGFKINKYIWDFGDGKKIETQRSDIIKDFNAKGNYNIKLTLEGIDNRFPNKITQKPATDIPTITVGYLVKIDENKLPNGGKIVSFDASDLKPLGEIEWYLKDDTTKPVYVGTSFQPSKVYFDEDAIGMLIRNEDKASGDYMDKIFIISGEKSDIKGEINYDVSIDNDLNYTFKVNKLENSFGDGFIKEFKWYIDNKEIKKDADILNLEESSKVSYIFDDYGKYTIKLVITNSNGKSIELRKEINTLKKLKLKNQIDIYQDNNKLEDVKYDPKTNEYFLYDLGVPTNLLFDAKMVRSDDPLYYLDNISWDIGDDGTVEQTGKSFQHNFDLEGSETVKVTYKFVHRRDKNVIINITEKINLDFVEKEANVDLKIKADSEYAPTIVSFDSSLSKVKDDNIVKFIYDYGDGVTEERDAINPGHRYLKEGNYIVKLTVVTERGKEYSTNRNLILKSFESKAEISLSMKKAPVNQEIDFLSSGSQGQIVGYHWDFGDGENSSEANPSHAYKFPGKFKVKLTLDFANNNILSEETEVEINE